MKQNSSTLATPQDHAILRSTLLKLTATQKILCTVVVAVVALVWYVLLNRLVAFGARMDYSGLQVLGAEATAFLQRYNAFFWWALVALCTLIIAYFLVGFVQSRRQHVRGKIVSADTFQALAGQLSEPAREVLRWAWQDRSRPVTVGVLQHAAAELRSGRAAKIVLARQQAQILGATTPDTLAPERNNV
ncbi:MAG TPA: hypothetical protein VL003_09355 [Pusillimonas sp.]|uniref:hypothetical protein n=1 Tax=Pusillimonas sp. TaxID=3040095 RepID=UPI002CE1522C|nr:hypothetical protein [Pusillimonas sp.]HUH88242.1 hypothetical protein [Pusillimonas sp.]